ncbi:MAG: PTS transporter subunit EIIC [Leptotrichiaceae bacterium]|nr:PTS transporter subunit EIIC [Leptotrichiaceae bacterium]MBP6280774.1 PTS transporter subunit EIIC [Leptotrichiaceae bacterium]MBP7099970.1 PTS transporter subunit EIIC [Leptotrichiaceae bacterium]MBP7725084.1 PTS transporter subunit EIIC [Leptotrichiaceae bacterium]MBP9629443.1 PTS transporter subunit EIIC [Leptotrichiaceae bacterium]
MDSKEKAKEIFDALGGKGNIISNATCMTRLRVRVREIISLSELKKIDGVMNVVESNDTLQIVLGPGIVNLVGQEFSKLTEIPLGFSDVKELANENKKINKKKYDGIVQKFLQKIANIFIPLLPGIIAAGLIMGLTNVINVTTKGQYNSEWWFASIRSIGFVMFGYLSLYVGMNSVKEFGGTSILGGIIGSIFIVNPSLPLSAKIGENSIILPFTNKPFSPGIGGLLAALFMGIIIAYIEKNVRKIMPNILDTFFTPLITLIIGVLMALLLIQPLGSLVTTLIFQILDFIYNKLGIVGGYILAAGFLPLVSVGLHQALTPIHVLLNNPEGPTNGINNLLPILIMAGGGQVGAGFAIYLKTKNEKLKVLTRDALPVGILGIGEPLMYAVTLPLGKPFITACLGSGFGGLLASLFHLGTITQGVSGLFGLLIVVPGTWIYFIIAMLGAYAGGFILTYLFGIDDERIEEIYG